MLLDCSKDLLILKAIFHSISEKSKSKNGPRRFKEKVEAKNKFWIELFSR